MDEIVIYTNKKTYFLHLLECIIFSIIGALGLIYKSNLCSYFAGHILINTSLFWIAWCILFGGFIGIFGTIYCIYSLFRPTKFIIRLNNDGFETVGYGFIKWNNVSKLDLCKIAGSSYITFDIKEGTLNNKVSTEMFSNPYVIALFCTGVNAKKLYNIMQQYLTRSQQS